MNDGHPSTLQHCPPHSDAEMERLQAQLRQLIQMRETGPKRAAWHAARMRLIWRLHDQIAQRRHAP